MTQVGDIEGQDAEKVNAAIEQISKGNFPAADAMLREVVANTPAEYQDQFEREGNQCIKFWSQEDFIYHVTRKREES